MLGRLVLLELGDQPAELAQAEGAVALYVTPVFSSRGMKVSSVGTSATSALWGGRSADSAL